MMVSSSDSLIVPLTALPVVASIISTDSNSSCSMVDNCQLTSLSMCHLKNEVHHIPYYEDPGCNFSLKVAIAYPDQDRDIALSKQLVSNSQHVTSNPCRGNADCSFLKQVLS